MDLSKLGTPQDVPRFKRADFDGTAPYDYIYRFAANAFQMMQIYNIVAAQAKEMGVKNFAKMWESYKRVQRGSGYNLDIEQAATNFPDQPMELRCGRYTCDAGGVACEDKGGYHTLVCSHPLMPVKRMENIDTGEQKVEIAFSRGGVWRYNVVDRTVLSSANKIVDLSRYGMDITTESARDVVKYLATIDALNYDKIGEVRSVGRLGWVGHELFSPYVPDLRYDGDAGYAATYKAVHPQGTLEGWLEAARHGRESSVITRVMLAAAFASVLVEPCDALPFVVHAWGGTGAGKAQPLDTLIITPDGSKRMGDMRVGDLVIGGDGKPHPVTGVYPQGMKNIFEITFADGRKTRCCKEHLWNVTTRTRRSYGRGYKTMELQEMLTRKPIKTAKGYEYQIPLCKPVEYSDSEALPIDPYLLGAMIGDGCMTLTQNKANYSRNLYFNNSEADVIARVSAELERHGSQLKRNPHTSNQFVLGNAKWLKDAIVNLGMNQNSYNKFIPDIYMKAAPDERRMLLCGLIDTDGHVGENGSVSYSTCSERLAYDVQRLAWSLGYKSTVSTLVRRGKDVPEYTVRISADEGVFLSEKHSYNKLRSVNRRNRAEDKTAMSIISVEPCGQAECQCIMVDSDEHTYLCDDFIVTHNTVGLMLAASVWADPTAGAFYKTFNATGVGQEMTAGFLNSLPLCLDELQVIKDKKDFDQTIYTLCEGVGRSRGAKAGGLQRMQTWRNAIITTGEMPITNADSGGGAVNRVINMDCQDEKLFADPRWAVSVMRRNYGHAGRAFVEHLTGGAMERAKELQKEYYAKLTEQDSTEKQALSASLLLAADTLATELLFQDDLALTVDDLAPMLVTRAEADVNARCYEWLTGFIAVNSNRFDESADNKGEVWGKLENDTCYFVATKFEQIMREYGYSSSSFLSWCSRVGKIKRQDGRNYKSVVRIRKNNTRCLLICMPPDGFVEVDDDDDFPFEQTKVTV